MEIVYLWINHFRNLKDLKMNLGSDFEYDIKFEKENKKCYINRTPNKSHLKGLFTPFLNVSAIVGENASGKSSLIEALRQVLVERRDYLEYVIIFQTGDVLYYEYFLGYEYGHNFLGEPDAKSIDFEFISNDFAISKRQNKKDHEVIYFSQIIDLNIYPVNHASPLGIDISSNWLSFDDIRRTPENSNYYELVYHKYCESLRQITFCQEFNKEDFVDNINLPNELDISTTTLSYDNNYWNTNYLLRGFDTILIEKINKEIGTSDQSKTKYLLFFLSNLIKCIYKNFEMSNRHLSTDVKLNITKEEIQQLPIEDAVKSFLKNQDLFDGNASIELIDKIKESIESSTDITDSSRNSWNIKLSGNTKEIIQKYDKFLFSLRKFMSYNITPFGFISFDWRNMSTGEKAFLNLFSRFYYAKNLIIDQVRNQQVGIGIQKKQFPKTIYILIDEGEIGFHLQWQKEYIQNLISVIPKILIFEGKEIEIQIIFTTHSPMSLSDIPNDRILYLDNGKEVNEKMKSFGANISELIAHSFFVKDGLIGKFAKTKINNTIKWLNDKTKIENSEFHKLLIQNIDEPIIQRKLAEMFSDKMKDNFSKEIIRQNILDQMTDFKTKYGEEL
jgi:predicted ATP-dependent endonuclease of OLD family